MPESGTRVKADERFAATDLLHRRVALDLRFPLFFGRWRIELCTNSPLLGAAIFGIGEPDTSDAGRRAALWEITVEARDGIRAVPAESSGPASEVHCFGAARACRMADGSWFVRRLPSMCGAGFAFVQGDEYERVMRLRAYIEAILPMSEFDRAGALERNEREVTQ